MCLWAEEDELELEERLEDEEDDFAPPLVPLEEWPDDELKDDDSCAPPLEPAALLIVFPPHPVRAKQTINEATIIFLFIVFASFVSFLLKSLLLFS